MNKAKSGMKHKQTSPKYKRLAISGAVSVLMVLAGLYLVEGLYAQKVLSGLVRPLLRLMFFIMIGLFAGQVIESSGWTRHLASFANPVFRFSHMGQRCAAAFTTAFFSGVAANAMLLDFFKDDKITRQQLFLSNFINQMPAYFLHLPTTIFIVLPLTGKAGILYFLLTFIAMMLRTILLLLYSRFFLPADGATAAKPDHTARKENEKQSEKVWRKIKARLPSRITGIAIYVLPIYTLVFVMNSAGFFLVARKWLAGYVVTGFMPMESLSVVILSFAAEFTSGFAAAGALMDAGVVTVKQTVMALLIGNIVAFPIRALRHQLPRYMGIFSPKMGSQLLLMGQGLRVGSLIITLLVYGIFF